MKKPLLFKIIFLLSVFAYQPIFAEADLPAQGKSILVNLNTADAEQLSSMLFGVGPSKAEAIVTYREENGIFESIEDLVMVSGIGIKTLEENRPLLTLE